MRNRLASAVLVAGLSLLPLTAQATYVGPSEFVPPHDGVYLSPANVHAIYDVSGLLHIVLQDIRHSGFSSPVNTPSGLNTLESFDSVVGGMVSINLGPFSPISLSGPVGVELFNYSPGGLGTFDTEMLSLDLSGGGVMIRESPTLPSTGQTTIDDIGGGLFRINSFFDVFTELSLDGGQVWIPSEQSTHVDLTNVPEPGAAGLLGFALVAFVALGYMRRERTGARAARI